MFVEVVEVAEMERRIAELMLISLEARRKATEFWPDSDRMLEERYLLTAQIEIIVQYKTDIAERHDVKGRCLYCNEILDADGRCPNDCSSIMH